MWEAILAVSIVMLALIVLLVIVYYFYSSKGLKHQKKHFEELHKELRKGCKVILTDGIHGKVVKLEAETLDLEIKSGSVMTVSRYAVSEIIK